MKRYNYFKVLRTIVVAFIVLVASNSISAQNKYLSFTDGEKQLASQSTLPIRHVKNYLEQGVEIHFEFTGAIVSEKEVKDHKYNYLHIDGIHKMGQVGAPALPAKNEIIAMPKGSKGKIVILEAEYEEYDGYDIHPALEPARDTEGAPEPQFQKNNAIYSKDEFFPKKIVDIADVFFNRGAPLALTQIVPVQFNPVSKKIRVYTKIHFKVEFIGGVGSFDFIAQDNSLHFTNLLKRNVINSESIPDGIPNNQVDAKNGAKNYIIITHSQYNSQANQLADWKRQLGYSAEVVSQSSWTATQVKSEISTRYHSWTPKPDYFVIIGDHDGSFAVPAEIHQTNDNPPEDFATDLYFACMDGTGDWHPDMAHGRISVSNSSEAQVVVDKIIDYEKNPPATSSFYQNGLNCAQYQDDDNNGYADRRFCHTSEDIRDYLQNDHGYSSERVYYTSSTAPVSTLRYNNDYYSNGSLLPAELRDASFDWGGGASDITSAINSGKFYVFHRDHGYVGGSGWAHPYYTTSSMTSLSNGDLLPVVFSINCHTGEFQLSNCFAEKFIRMSGKGAVGVIGAAYYSLSGYNDALAIGMVDAIWATPGVYPVMGSAGSGANYTIGDGNEIYTMGDVMNQGLYAMEQNVSWSSSRQYEYELFHWFGDPAMKIWTDNPNNTVITATHASTIDVANSTFNISSSTPGATATILFNNTLIGEIVLDASGNGDIPYSITESGSTATLTISKHNCKPYESTLTVTGSGSFPPSMATQAASNITENTASLNGEIVDDQGDVVTESGFVYSTSPDPVIGGTGVMQVQTAPTVTSGTYSIDITSLQSNTTYYYKAYAINANGTGYGDETSFTTLCGIISIFPMNEGFESGNLPNCWSYDGTAWAFQNGGHSGYPASAHSGSYNALFYHGSSTPDVSKLISPTIDFSSCSDATLTFWHAQTDWSGDQDELRVYYKNSAGGTWTMLAEYTSNIADWAERSINLPNLSSDYSIAFEATGQYGYGVVIDDIEIAATTSCTPPSTQASNFSINATNDNDVTISWTRGNGDGVLVVAKESNAVNADPANGNSYTANANFSAGDEIGTGNYVVYDGSGTSVNITGLNTGTNYYFAIYEYNTAEYCYLTPALTGSATTTGTNPCIITSFPYSQDFSAGALPNCWENIDNEGSGQVWQFNNPGGITFNATSAANGFAILDSDNYGSGNSQNADLITPSLDLSAASGVTLNFEHYFKSYSGSSGSLYYSVNGGSSWTLIQTWTTTTSDPEIFSQDLSSQLVGQSNVKFKWNYTGSWGYYWAIDDIEISIAALPAPENLVATVSNNTDADLIWNKPTVTQGGGTNYGTPSWYSHIQMADYTSLNWPTPERGTLFDDADFSFNYPAQITKISHGFYEHTDYPWPDATFHFKIYGADGTTLLYESSDIEAVHDTEIEHTLSTPLEISGDFYVMVAPVDASGHPSSLSKSVTPGTTHSYSGSAGNWTIYDDGTNAYEFMTRVYLAVEQTGKEVAISYEGNSPVEQEPSNGLVDHKYIAEIEKDQRTTPGLVKDGAKATLSGYKVYRNGASTATYTITNPDDTTYTDAGLAGGTYDYYVTAIYTSPDGESDPSNTETVVILTAPTATVSATPGCNTGSITVTSDLSGSQTFYLCDDGGTTLTSWTGNATEHEFTGQMDGIYKGKVEKDGLMSVLSGPVTLTNETTPVAPTSVGATSLTICDGESTELTYSGGSGNTFAWFTSSCGGTQVGTGNNLSVTPTSSTTYYGRWENSCGNSSCLSVTITVNPLPQAPAAVSATSSVICIGENTQLTYSGGSGDNFYWYTSSCGGTLVGSGNNLSVSPTSTTTYYGRWENTCGSSTCESIVVTVNPLTAITLQPQSATLCEGENVEFTVAADGTSLTYQWCKDGSSISGATSVSYNIYGVAPADEGDYTCEVTGDCGTETSNPATLTVDPLPVAPTAVSATPASICEGESTLLSYSGGSGDSFAWYTSSCGGTLVGTGNDLTVDPTTTTTYYGRWENNCGNSDCEIVEVIVNPLTVITTHPQSNTVCETDNVEFSIVADGLNLTYQWYKDGSSISGATGSSYSISSAELSDEGDYTCEVTGDCGTETSDPAALTVDPATAITEHPTDVEAVEGEEVSFTVAADGTNLAYQWRFEGSNITGENSASYVIDAVAQDDEGMYDVVVTGDCGEVTSNEAELTVLISVAEMTGDGMNIYPNPAGNSVYLDLPKEFNNYTVVIFGSKGEMVWQKDFVYNGESNRRINLSGINAGVYHLKVFTGKLYHIEKLIIR